MGIDPLTPLASLSRLPSAAPMTGAETVAASGFAGILGQVLAGNQQANAVADAAVQDLATGKAQDVHGVALAVAQADLSFRMILELRNRLSDAFQEVTRMQV